MSFLTFLRNICDIYPVQYIVMSACGMGCLIPSILLLVAVLRSSIHSNCRMLMSLWIVAQLFLYGTVCWLCVYFIVTKDRYFKESFDTTGLEVYILSWYLPVWLMTTFFELGISLERGFSIRQPCKYHSSKASYITIGIYSILSMLFSFQISAWILSGAETIEAGVGTFFSNLLDVGAFTTNGIVLLFAQRKNKVEHKQLNERYQIRETYLIARTMMPVYCLSTALKLIIIAANWMYVMSIVPLTVSQTIYLSLSEISCGLTSLMFILHHVRLRSKLDLILGRSNRVISIIEDHQDANTTVNHFQMLTYTWNHK